MRLALLACFAATFIGTLVRAAISMEFSEQFNGAMRIDNNSAWIYADGDITADTPAQFEAFLANTSMIFEDQRIVLNSRGGNVIAGITLGLMIRENEFRTAVGRAIKNGQFWDLGAGECSSSCVFALAGGTQRLKIPGSQIGVHQISVDFTALYREGAANHDRRPWQELLSLSGVHRPLTVLLH